MEMLRNAGSQYERLRDLLLYELYWRILYFILEDYLESNCLTQSVTEFSKTIAVKDKKTNLRQHLLGVDDFFALGSPPPHHSVDQRLRLFAVNVSK